MHCFNIYTKKTYILFHQNRNKSSKSVGFTKPRLSAEKASLSILSNKSCLRYVNVYPHFDEDDIVELRQWVVCVFINNAGNFLWVKKSVFIVSSN